MSEPEEKTEPIIRRLLIYGALDVLPLLGGLLSIIPPLSPLIPTLCG